MQSCSWRTACKRNYFSLCTGTVIVCLCYMLFRFWWWCECMHRVTWCEAYKMRCRRTCSIIFGKWCLQLLIAVKRVCSEFKESFLCFVCPFVSPGDAEDRLLRWKIVAQWRIEWGSTVHCPFDFQRTVLSSGKQLVIHFRKRRAWRLAEVDQVPVRKTEAPSGIPESAFDGNGIIGSINPRRPTTHVVEVY